MGTVTLLVRCACGWEVAADSEAEVVAATQDHGRRLHNMNPTPEQVLAMLVPAGPGSTADTPSKASIPQADGDDTVG